MEASTGTSISEIVREQDQKMHTVSVLVLFGLYIPNYIVIFQIS